ncbi:MAG: hypothetical protein VYD96_08245 [Pseudomonadota bacterium]|nr:hypothetical protein [Pseudomonadota bacterium]
MSLRPEFRRCLTGTDLDVLVLGGGINADLVASELTQCAILMRPPSDLTWESAILLPTKRLTRPVQLD